ncbi:16S rRNA (cytosine(967)-C(5))-methyltransferase RsmB [Saccharobesus litoralis]|uniref:16S rRNA (cytosine(967)-C(5))-methyltransferase n=1 Tax=Saccharobesus litoralis TaxID=2172099 RepID=A0A2S0VQG6_9ALTE|nr:16S rRNA (cytosine(967)-C(5))-methyltransferase RsmB [Saccharobesus litoralis]AWB66451.1 16S rRNA (cytosine(967)-C(5))-methyltransferase RsmB [Saccharobesus litoralis]
MLNNRAIAAKLILQVLDQGISLSQSLAKQTYQLESQDKGQIQDLVFSTLRQLPTFSFCLNQLTEQNLAKELNLIRYLICLGMYQLSTERVAEHAALAETVEACRQLGFEKLTGLVNGVLRNFQRQQDDLLAKAQHAGLQVSSNHPQWLISELKQAYPKGFKKILKANLKHPPFWLRVNTKVTNAEDFCQALTDAEIAYQQDKHPNTLLLEQAVNVDKLPGFAQGSCTVQDKAAQQAALLLDAQAGERILDCCAAPGGKTAHILSHTPDVGQVVALDIDMQRLNRVNENLHRLQLQAEILAGDASQVNQWWDGQLFDRVLLDAPCSATGVIRRHPDIMYLRRPEDISVLADLQQKILKQMWQIVKPGGILLYATCSVLPIENKQQITRFLQEQSDAELVPIFDSETATDPGWQILPGSQNMDGFYYARLRKLK